MNNNNNGSTTKVKLYWNNICVLNKREVALLRDIRERLLGKDIELEVQQFGLGYPQHMSDNLRQPGAELPDILVSADLEVFEDRRIFDTFSDSLYPVAQWVAGKKDGWLEPMWRDDRLLPYLAIPLVLYTWQPERYRNKSLTQIISEQLPLSFGGRNNSAGKSIAKLVWSTMGKDAVASLLDRSGVHEIPMQAFRHVKTTHEGAALVPTVYTLTADGKQDYTFCPTSGAVGVPSYIAARNSISEQVARAVIYELTHPDMCTFYVEKGCLICPIEGSPTHPWVASNIEQIDLPGSEWLATTAPEDFYQMYLAHVPGARI